VLSGYFNEYNKKTQRPEHLLVILHRIRKMLGTAIKKKKDTKNFIVVGTIDSQTLANRYKS
jgi:hypothetical protein